MIQFGLNVFYNKKVDGVGSLISSIKKKIHRANIWNHKHIFKTNETFIQKCEFLKKEVNKFSIIFSVKQSYKLKRKY